MMALTVLQSPLTVVLQEGVKIVLQEVSPYYLLWAVEPLALTPLAINNPIMEEGTEGHSQMRLDTLETVKAAALVLAHSKCLIDQPNHYSPEQQQRRRQPLGDLLVGFQ